MNWRAIIPVVSFLIAGASFAFGTVQYFQARGYQAYARQQVALSTSVIQNSSLRSDQKTSLLASLFSSMPKRPTTFALDFSGSRASDTTGQTDTACMNQGHRDACRALRDEIRACDLDGTSACTMRDANIRAFDALCGLCGAGQ